MMTIKKAQGIIEAGIAKAKEIGQPMNIAVVDAGANLTAFVRMDAAWLGSIDIAINREDHHSVVVGYVDAEELVPRLAVAAELPGRDIEGLRGKGRTFATSGLASRAAPR
jgi:hypothetical protein